MKPQRISNKDYYTSASFALISALFLSITASLGKNLTATVSLNLIVFIRFIFPFLLISTIYLFFHNKNNIKANFKFNLLRSIFTVIGQYCFFILLVHGNLLLATLLFSSNALFMPFLARIALKVEIKIKTIIAIVIGFIGIAVTLGPISNIISFDTLIGLICGFCIACSQIIFHYLSKKQDPVTINFLSYGLSSIITLILLLSTIHYVDIINPHLLLSWKGLIVILAFSITSIANQIFRSLAYKRVNKAATLAPFLYFALIFSVIFDWLWWGIIPTWYNYVGIVIILISSSIMAFRRVKS